MSSVTVREVTIQILPRRDIWYFQFKSHSVIPS